jgi:hypothetical protein
MHFVLEDKDSVVSAIGKTIAPGGGYVDTEEGDSLLVLEAQPSRRPVADGWPVKDYYVMNYRLRACGWILPQELGPCKLPQWDLGFAVAGNGALMAQLILRDSTGRNMLAGAWRQYEWPFGLTFRRKEAAMNNGVPTAIHMSLHDSRTSTACCGWGADDLESLARGLAIVFQGHGINCLQFHGFFRHDVYWFMSTRPVVCAAFDVRTMEIHSTPAHGSRACLGSGPMLEQVRFVVQCIGEARTKFILPCVRLHPYSVLHVTSD